MPMMVRSLAKSVLVLQPGYSLRALNNKFKLVLAMARQWPELSAFMQRTSSVLGKQRMARLGVDCIGVVQWPYISKSWKAPLRSAVRKRG